MKWSSLVAKKQRKISALLRKKYDKIDYEFDNIQEICQKKCQVLNSIIIQLKTIERKQYFVTMSP